MPIPIRFSDDPNNKIVTAHFDDGTSIVIESMSNLNYTNPPGYGDPAGTAEIYGQAMRNRVAQYKIELSNQIN
jgi:hypothetical protein